MDGDVSMTPAFFFQQVSGMRMRTSSVTRVALRLALRRVIGTATRLCALGARGLLFGGLAGTLACHGILDTSDPTLIQDKDIANANGANARRLNAVAIMNVDLTRAFVDIALFGDELTYEQGASSSSLGFPSYGKVAYDLDRHDDVSLLQYAEWTGRDRELAYFDETFSRTSLAIAAMRAYGAAAVKHDYLAQLFAIRGYVVVQMAENICPGFPINDISEDNTAVFSQPYSYTAALDYGITQLDSALAEGQDSTQFLDFARVVKGRALLDQGKYAQADSVVAPVPTSFTYTTDPSAQYANVFFVNVHYDEGYPMPMGDHEGGNGLPFLSAADPRVPSQFIGMSSVDPTDSLFGQAKYPTSSDPIVLASGIEARLIQAEAALDAGDPNWLTILNTLRATLGLTALADPGTTAARVDLLYSERAFWLYLTGHRLGDMRRLILNYGRDPVTVFPVGPYQFGDSYGVATAIPFSQKVQGRANPHITTGCTTR